MAVFYGSDSSFIKGKQKRRRILLLLVIVIALFGGIGLFFTYRKIWYVSPIAVFFMIALTRDWFFSTAKDLTKEFWSLRRLKGNADRGLLGEKIVKQKLESLPETYCVFQGFRPNSRNDIDFIVVGPNGLFAVEVKSQTGKLTFEKGSYGNKLLWQARKEALELYRFFLEGWKLKAYVTGILVFARSGAKLPDLSQSQESVYIVKADDLVQTILNHHGSLPQKELFEERLRFFYSV